MQPKLLEAAAPAVVGCILASNCKVFWLPKHDSKPTSAGSWVSAAEACFLPISSPDKIDMQVINVARRAGLQVPEMPDNVVQVIIHLCQLL